MSNAPCDELTTLNQQLAALAEAGVPLDAGWGRTPERTTAALRHVNQTVMRRTEQGESLTESLEGDVPAVPQQYRCLVQWGLQANALGAVAEEAHLRAAPVQRSATSLRLALGYPLLICAMAYVGLIGFSLVLEPILAQSYSSLRIKWGSGMYAASWLRATMPLWIWVPPLLAIGGGAWWWLKRHQIVTVRSAKWMKLVPGLQRTVYQDYLANFAEMLAVQLEQGVSLEESLRVAACAGGDARLVEASRGLIVALRRGALPAVDDLVALRFPPFLRWAIWSEQQPNAQATALRLAANIYRDSACKRFEYLRWVAPVVLGALIGGGVTLLYALAFFKPVTDMLYELTK